MGLRFERYFPTRETAEFESGEPEIDEFLRKDEAAEYRRQSLGHTYLAMEDGALVGFVTLAASAVTWPATALPLNLGGVALNRLPAILIGQLAVATRFKRQGRGTAMVTHIVRYAMRPNRTMGIRLVIVDSLKKPEPLALYTKCGFRQIPCKPQKDRKTVPMYLDLMALSRKESGGPSPPR